MKASQFISLRLIAGWELETEAKVLFTTTNKKGHNLLEDAEWVKPDDLCTKGMVNSEGTPVTNNLQFFLAKLEINQSGVIPFADKDKYGYYSTWNNLDHLAKTAEKLQPGFMNLWKWVKKTYPIPMRVTRVAKGESAPSSDFTPKDMDNFLRADLISLYFILKHNLTGELTKWTDGLKKGGYCYCTPLASFMSDPEVY